MYKETLENTEGAIKNGQSRENGNIGHTKRREKNNNTISVGHHYTQTNTNNVNKNMSGPCYTLIGCIKDESVV